MKSWFQKTLCSAGNCSLRGFSIYKVWFSRHTMWKQRSQEQAVQLRSSYLSQALTYPCYVCVCDDSFYRTSVQEDHILRDGEGQELDLVKNMDRLTFCEEELSHEVGRLRKFLCLKEGWMWLWWGENRHCGQSVMPMLKPGWFLGGWLPWQGSGCDHPVYAQLCEGELSHAWATGSREWQRAAPFQAFWGTLHTRPISSSPLTKWQKPKSDLQLPSACLNRQGCDPSSHALLLIASDSPDLHLQD